MLSPATTAFTALGLKASVAWSLALGTAAAAPVSVSTESITVPLAVYAGVFFSTLVAAITLTWKARGLLAKRDEADALRDQADSQRDAEIAALKRELERRDEAMRAAAEEHPDKRYGAYLLELDRRRQSDEAS